MRVGGRVTTAGDPLSAVSVRESAGCSAMRARAVAVRSAMRCWRANSWLQMQLKSSSLRNQVFSSLSIISNLELWFGCWCSGEPPRPHIPLYDLPCTCISLGFHIFSNESIAGLPAFVVFVQGPCNYFFARGSKYVNICGFLLTLFTDRCAPLVAPQASSHLVPPKQGINAKRFMPAVSVCVENFSLGFANVDCVFFVHFELLV